MRAPLAVLLVAAAAGSTVSPLRAADPPTGAMPTLDCAAMAGRPGAPMTMEQCERQVAIMGQMQQAMNAPGGAKPGDEAMECPQIIAEMKAQGGAGVSPRNAAESVAAGKALRGAYGNAEADASAAMAAGTATTAAAALAAPLPGGNAAGGAAAMSLMAQQQTLSAKHGPLVGDARSRAMAANANASTDVIAMMQANPRIGRLVQLAGAKGCSGDF